MQFLSSSFAIDLKEQPSVRRCAIKFLSSKDKCLAINNPPVLTGRQQSVRLESRYLNCDKFTTTSVCSIPTAQCQVSDERYGAAGQCAKNRSHICSRARKRYAWLTYVNFRKGRQSDER